MNIDVVKPLIVRQLATLKAQAGAKEREHTPEEREIEVFTKPGLELVVVQDKKEEGNVRTQRYIANLTQGGVPLDAVETSEFRSRLGEFFELAQKEKWQLREEKIIIAGKVVFELSINPANPQKKDTIPSTEIVTISVPTTSLSIKYDKEDRLIAGAIELPEERGILDEWDAVSDAYKKNMQLAPFLGFILNHPTLHASLREDISLPPEEVERRIANGELKQFGDTPLATIGQRVRKVMLECIKNENATLQDDAQANTFLNRLFQATDLDLYFTVFLLSDNKKNISDREMKEQIKEELGILAYSIDAEVVRQITRTLQFRIGEELVVQQYIGDQDPTFLDAIPISDAHLLKEDATLRDSQTKGIGFQFFKDNLTISIPDQADGSWTVILPRQIPPFVLEHYIYPNNSLEPGVFKMLGFNVFYAPPRGQRR